MELPDTFCPSKGPTNQQACSKQECPPQWVTTDWSQVGLTKKTQMQYVQFLTLLVFISYIKICLASVQLPVEMAFRDNKQSAKNKGKMGDIGL